MKVEFPKAQVGYSPYAGFQFAEVERTHNKVGRIESCKEVFSSFLMQREVSPPRRFRFLMLLTNWENNHLLAATTQDFLNQVEKEMGFGKSKVWDVSSSAKEGTQALLIDSSASWLKNSPLIHLFLLLVRNGSGHNPSKTWKTTLAKFRRTQPFRPLDKPQFLIIRDSLQYIINKKGNLRVVHPGVSARQEGIGICQWVQRFQEEESDNR